MQTLHQRYDIYTTFLRDQEKLKELAKEVKKYKRKEERVSQLKPLLEERDEEIVALKQKAAVQRHEVIHLTADLAES